MADTMHPRVTRSSPVPTAPKTAPKRAPKRRPSVGVAKFPRPAQIRSDLAGLSAPKFTSSTGAVVSLLFLNFAWSVWRTIVNAGSDVRTKLVQNVAGIWVVGLGILLLAEFQPHLALLFVILLTIGNIISETQGTTVFGWFGVKTGQTPIPGQANAITAFGDIFTKGG